MKILISDKIHEYGIKILEDAGFDIDKNFSIEKDELKEEIENYDAIIIRSRTKLTSEVIKKGTQLKAIGRAGVGLDNVDVEEAENLGIKVFNTPEAPSVSVAELTIGLILSLTRYISNADKTMHCGEWCKNDYMGHVLKDKKLGLIGFGNIGIEVAKRAAAFEMIIGIYDIDEGARNIAKDLGYNIYNSLEALIQDCKIISLHLPSTTKTEDIINEKQLSLMNENTLIINTARGTLINEVALLNALNNKKIGGAALDVYREEPLNNMDLCSCDNNLILTPHIGSQTVETQIEASTGIAIKISNYLKSLK
ncbi:MAG: hydroxyacid dehydrogenase [Candidatus Lokiarchaeota archaeon]|nr:hydroxyacid dehydrogenase [Candidatus Lokiarchaeota archaeon]